VVRVSDAKSNAVLKLDSESQLLNGLQLVQFPRRAAAGHNLPAQCDAAQLHLSGN